MKLSKKAARRIASLINTTHCSIYMVDSALEKKNFAEATRWRIEGDTATIRLFEEFGIRLPNLAGALERHAAEHRAAEAARVVA